MFTRIVDRAAAAALTFVLAFLRPRPRPRTSSTPPWRRGTSRPSRSCSRTRASSRRSRAPGPFTVFAPTDEAFAKVPEGHARRPRRRQGEAEGCAHLPRRRRQAPGGGRGEDDRGEDGPGRDREDHDGRGPEDRRRQHREDRHRGQQRRHPRHRRRHPAARASRRPPTWRRVELARGVRLAPERGRLGSGDTDVPRIRGRIESGDLGSRPTTGVGREPVPVSDPTPLCGTLTRWTNRTLPRRRR